MGFKYIKFSSVGFEKKFNEDAVEVVEVDGGILAVLCDGVGGDYGGDMASKIAIKSATYFFTTSNSDDYLERIKYSLEESNNFVINHSASSEVLKSMATTIEMIFIKDNIAFWGHIGDSRIYHIRSGKIKQLTKDHSLVQKLLDEGFITHQQAANHPNKNVIMKALGDNPFVDPDISKIKLNEYEKNKFFVCSDGITNLVSNNELEEILNLPDMDEKKSQLIKLVKLRGAFDDYSFIYIEKD
ncbi:MAG: protein phosphatase 2C domain-containing protein [Ignavibacteriaceae bacterium]